MGTPAQTITAFFDTGFSEFWVNPDCRYAGLPAFAEVCEAGGHYDAAESSTSQPSNETFDIAYGIGEVFGYYHKDTVSFAGGCATCVGILLLKSNRGQLEQRPV